MQGIEKNTRRVILPSDYAGYGVGNWTAPGLTARNRADIADLIEALTEPVEGQGGARELGPQASVLSKPGESGFVPEGLDEVDALWKEVRRSGEVTELDSLFGHVSLHRQYAIKSARGASLVGLYAALASGQTFRTCANCEAVFAAGHKVTNHFCTEKCRARASDVARRARQAEDRA